MTSRVLSHSQVSRDLPRTYVVLACAAIGVGLVIFGSYYWQSFPRESAAASQLNDANSSKHYVGSILADPPRGDMCWERVFDNRTGNMWDNGYVKCDNAPPQLWVDSQQQGLDAWRMHEVGKAFRRKDE